MRKRTWNIRLFLLAVLMAASVSGCRQKEQKSVESTVTFLMVPSSEGVKDFLKCLGDYDSGYDSDVCCNVTPKETAEKYDFNIFKFDTSCGSFLLYDREVYPLGVWFGGHGVTSFAVSDLNGDGAFELFFTFSWGSGAHRSQAGYFDSAKREVVLLEFVNFYRDSLLGVDEEGVLCVYDAECNVKSFVDIEMTAGDKLASIIAEEGIISIVEEENR